VCFFLPAPPRWGPFHKIQVGVSLPRFGTEALIHFFRIVQTMFGNPAVVKLSGTSWMAIINGSDHSNMKRTVT
jgi:hypothetical protein